MYGRRMLEGRRVNMKSLEENEKTTTTKKKQCV